MSIKTYFRSSSPWRGGTPITVTWSAPSSPGASMHKSRGNWLVFLLRPCGKKTKTNSFFFFKKPTSTERNQRTKLGRTEAFVCSANRASIAIDRGRSRQADTRGDWRIRNRVFKDAISHFAITFKLWFSSERKKSTTEVLQLIISHKNTKGTRFQALTLAATWM